MTGNLLAKVLIILRYLHFVTLRAQTNSQPKMLIIIVSEPLKKLLIPGSLVRVSHIIGWSLYLENWLLLEF